MIGEENKTTPQVVIHKSNWSSQVITVIIVLIAIFFAIKNNPTKNDFQKELLVEFSKKYHVADLSTSNFIAETLSDSHLIGKFIRRRDFILFSTYEIDFDNESFKLHASGFGFFNNVFLDDNLYIELNPPSNAPMPLHPLDPNPTIEPNGSPL